MLDDFTKDLKKGRAAEKIVFDTLRSLTTDYEFTDVSKDYTCYKIGDIRATDKVTGKDIYIEVKNDSRIADTHKVLCEEEVYYLDRNSYGSGNMDGYGDIYVVVSEQERKIYIMDLKKLQKNYLKIALIDYYSI